MYSAGELSDAGEVRKKKSMFTLAAVVVGQ